MSGPSARSLQTPGRDSTPGFQLRFPPPSGRETPGLGRGLPKTSLRLISSWSVTHQLLISYLSVTISSVGLQISPRARGVGTRPGRRGERGPVLTALRLNFQELGFESL